MAKKKVKINSSDILEVSIKPCQIFEHKKKLYKAGAKLTISGVEYNEKKHKVLKTKTSKEL